ncbi:MAG: pseudouridine synthase [Candidatus Acidiferrales bacterium]
MLQRLQKIIAQAGIASRRHAEELIRSGQVRVNGAVVTELGSKADPDHDRVEVAGRVAEIPDAPVYIVLNKPPQVVSTMADPEGRPTLRNYLRGMPERVFPVGRLDYAASGLCLLTSDGQLTARVLRASSRLRQTYWIKVKGRISESEMHEAGRAASAHFEPLKGPWARRSAENPWYEVELTGASRDALGRSLKRQDHPIEKMKRVKLATLELGPVPEGHYRRLEPDEVDKFSRAVDRALEEKNEPAVAPPIQRPVAMAQQKTAPPIIPAPAAPPNTPWQKMPQSQPQATPREPWRGAPNNRHVDRPREPWRARAAGGPPRQNMNDVPKPPRQPWPGAPKHRPASPAKEEWRPRKSGPWRGNKTSGDFQPRDNSRPSTLNQRSGAPTHRPDAPGKNDWRERKSAGPWRGNNSSGAPSSPSQPRPGAPTHRPGASGKNDWRERKPAGLWRGNKSSGARHSPNHPRPGAPTHRSDATIHRPGAPAKNDWRERKSAGPWRGNKSSGAQRPPNDSQRPPRPRNPNPKPHRRSDRDPRHTPRNSR